MSEEPKKEPKVVRVIMKTLNGPYKTVGYMTLVGLPDDLTDPDILRVLEERAEKRYISFAIDQPDGVNVMCMRDIEHAPMEEPNPESNPEAASAALSMLDLLLKKGEHEQ